MYMMGMYILPRVSMDPLRRRYLTASGMEPTPFKNTTCEMGGYLQSE